jgi:membrane protease YdiL (CAAX protease family)
MPSIDRLWLIRLAELVAVVLLSLYFPQIVSVAADALHVPLPTMPLLRRAYLYFVLTILVCLYLLARGEGLASIGLVTPKRWPVLIGRGLLLFVAILVFEIGVTPFTDPLIAHATGTSAKMGEVYFASVRGNFGLFAYLAVFGVFFGGLGEEILHRGFIMTRIAQLLGESRGAWIATVVLQAIPFAAGHAYQGPAGMFGVFVIAMIYAVGAIAWGRNLWPAIVAHAVFDTFGFYAIYSGIAHA